MQQVLANKQRLRDVGDRRDFLAQRIRNREPWGEFHFPDERELRGRKLWFYVVPTPELKALASCPLPWQVVHREPRQAFVVVLSESEPPSDAMPVPRTHTGSETLRELRPVAEEECPQLLR